MWGLFFLALGMIFLGFIVQIETSRPTQGIVGSLWFVVMWFSASGNVRALARVSKWAFFIQAISVGMLSVTVISSGNSFLEISNGMFDALSIFIPLFVWILVVWRAHFVRDSLISVASRTPIIPIDDSGLKTPLAPSLGAGGVINPLGPILEEPDMDSEKADMWGSFSKANILIEYDDRAAYAWNELDAVSEALKLKFMRALDADTKQNVDNLKEVILEEHHRVLHPFDTDELNVAHAKAKKLSKACAEEFMRAYDVLGDTISAENLLEKVSKKYENPQIASDEVEDLANAIKSKNQREILECLKKTELQS